MVDCADFKCDIFTCFRRIEPMLILQLNENNNRLYICIIVYSGKNKDDRTSAGVGVLLHKRFQYKIDDIDHINENILKITLTVTDKHTHILSVYSRNISKSREVRRHFYETS